MDSRQWSFVSLAGVLVLVVIAGWLFWPPATQIKQGLDLRGGLSVILTAEKAVDSAAMDRALLIMQNRVNGLGVSEATVQKEGSQAILVQLPGVKDAQAALEAIGNTGQLEFVDWNSIPATEQITWDTYFETIRKGGQAKRPANLKPGTYKVLLRGDVVTNATAGASTQAGATGGYEVDMTFNQAGSVEWAKITSEYYLTKRQVAIVLDGQVESAPQIEGPITGGQSQITGSFTADEAKRLALVLQTGALPVTLKPSDTQEVGPTLGQQSLQQGLLAAIAGLIIVAIYLAVYYRGLGVLSWIALGIFGCLYLGILAALSRAGAFALSLPGIAGVVLSIGMAADTSILIFERFREEIAMGKTPRSAAKSGTKHALLTSVDADVVTFVSAVAIYALAVGPVRGFALTLILGLITDLTVGFLFTRPTVILLAESVIAKAPALFGVKGGGAGA
ncbi:MAG TPA: protein translocase subunit SecD [Coriobacteriia bacterium]